MRSKDSYNQEGAQKFIEFLNSDSGQTHQGVLYKAFRGALGDDKTQKILDAACGPGWLSAKLQPEFPNIECCDGSQFFLDYLKKTYPNLATTPTKKVDLAEPLPYADNEFDTIIFSLAAQDMEDQQKTFSYLNRILKPNGKLLLAIPNPYYAYPVGIWKRTILGKLFGGKPKFKVRPYNWFGKAGKANRNYVYRQPIQSYFYKLSEHLNNIISSGFTLRRFEDLECAEDDPDMGFQYSLHRYPILLFMEFKKTG
jgi:ubiquinone/menaquinone biosynthesis C-methylase UbiE